VARKSLSERHLRRHAGRGGPYRETLRSRRPRPAGDHPGFRLGHPAREDARVDPPLRRAGDAPLPQELVSMVEFETLLRTLSNWGKGGPDDERGTLNYITPEVRQRAAGLVRQGKTFSLAIPIRHGSGPQTGGARINPLHLMTATGCDPG